MSRGSYLPVRQADQLKWAKAFSTVVGADATVYGVPAGLMMQFSGDVAALELAWTKANTPETRSKVSVDKKNQALRKVTALANKLVSIIQGTPTVTSDMLLAAGLTVRKTTRTAPVVPQTKPYIRVVRIDGRRATLELSQSKIKRGRPAGVAGATVFLSAPGLAEAPRSFSAWTFATNTTKTTFEYTFPPSETGDAYYVTAFWSNSLDESGPAADAVRLNLPAGEQMPTATAGATTRLRAA